MVLPLILPLITIIPPIFPFPSAFGPSSSNAQGYGDLYLVTGRHVWQTRVNLKGRETYGGRFIAMEKKNYGKSPTLLEKLGILLYGTSRFIADFSMRINTFIPDSHVKMVRVIPCLIDI